MKIKPHTASNRRLYLAIIILAVALVYFLKNVPEQVSGSDTLRNYHELVYTKHAQCRMACRSIDEQEIKFLIENGKLNKSKSGYDKKHKNTTYALEGYSQEKQHIRVVVTPRADDLLVITVIDLDKDWACDCD